MRIRVQRIEDGPARVEVIDPSDGAVTHGIDVNVGEEVTVMALTATSPADLEVGEVGPIAAEEAPAEAEEGPGDGTGSGPDAEEPTGGAEQGEDPDGGEQAAA